MRNSLTTSHDARGRHDVKIGGGLFLHQHYEQLHAVHGDHRRARRRGAGKHRELLPDAFNADTWNLAAISPLVRRYTLGILKSRRDVIRIPGYGVDAGRLAHERQADAESGRPLRPAVEHVSKPGGVPALHGVGPSAEPTNIQPRLRFTYSGTRRRSCAAASANAWRDGADDITPSEAKTVAVVEVLNDGRPDFAANPFNGPAPTYEQALQRYCAAPEQAANFAAWRARGFTGNAPCLLRGNGELKQPPPYNINSSWQSSIGFQRQVGSVSAVEVDYIFTKSRDEGWQQQNSNIRFNPATGVNYPFSDRSLLPYPRSSASWR